MDFSQQVVVIIRRILNRCEFVISMKIATIFVWVVFVLMFVCWYMPVSFFNVYACDDFWHGANVIENGFLQAQLRFYLSWEGSFVHTFLATLPHVFKGSHVPFVINMLTMISLVVSASCFLKVYLIKVWSKAILCAISMAVIFLVVTGCGAEIRFWVCSSFPYIFGVSSMLLFLAFYHKAKLSSWSSMLLLWLLQLIVVGNKVSYIIFLFVSMIMHDVIFKKFCLKNIMMVYFPAALFSLINMAAPGNYVRLSQNLGSACALPFFEVIGIRFMHLIPMLMWSLVFPLPIFDGNPPRRRTIIMILLGVIIFFLMESTCLYFCFRDPGPLRTYVLTEIMIFGLGVVVRDTVLHKIRPTMCDLSICKIVCWVVLCFAQFGLIRQVSPTLFYAEKAAERNLLVKAQIGSGVIRVPKLPPSYLLVSYFANDIIWLENVYLRYFGIAGSAVVFDNGSAQESKSCIEDDKKQK